MDARPDDDAGADDTTGAQQPADAPGRPTGGGSTPGADSTASSAEDDVWASIVARLSDVDLAVGPVDRAAPAPRPVQDRATDDRGADDDVLDGPPATVGAPPTTGRDWDGTSQYDAAEGAVDDQEHFVPQDPGPVLGGDPLLTLAWVAAAGMPVFLLVVVIAWQGAPTVLVRAAAGLFVLAVAVLVWRMPQRREPTDDDGAVV